MGGSKYVCSSEPIKGMMRCWPLGYRHPYTHTLLYTHNVVVCCRVSNTPIFMGEGDTCGCYTLHPLGAPVAPYIHIRIDGHLPIIVILRHISCRRRFSFRAALCAAVVCANICKHTHGCMGSTRIHIYAHVWCNIPAYNHLSRPYP
jgi:hypothetical protein